MARRADDLPEHLLVDDDTSGLSDDVLAESFTNWLAELDEVELLHLPVTASDTLAEARAAGEV